MKPILLSVLFLIMPLLLVAQNGIDKKIFLDSTFKKTDENYTYYRIIKDVHLEKSFYEVEEYYKSDKLMSRGKSLNKDFMMLHGEYITYYENGNKKSQRQFSSGQPTGNYNSWYENGSKKSEGEYVKSELKINQFWNTDSVQTVKDGNGFFEDDNQLLQKGNLLNGLKEGEWTGEDKKAKFTFKEIYSNGKFVSGESIDAENKKHKYKEINEMPKPKGGIEGFRSYIAQKFKTVNMVSGTILANFVVEKNGEITDIKIIRSLGEELDKMAIRALRSSKFWTPGKTRGIGVRVAYTIPLAFR